MEKELTAEEILYKNAELEANCKVKYNKTEKGILSAMEEYSAQKSKRILELEEKLSIVIEALSDISEIAYSGQCGVIVDEALNKINK